MAKKSKVIFTENKRPICSEHPVFTKALEMTNPVLKEVDSQVTQLLPWQHTLYSSLNFKSF